ncbi:hypothetical protein [Geotalea sp. SG265]|uniref:hypothetical protein n=1 Tax=Geotalea sp. SG265 TaxID=2922867 RepID=UPI001FB021DF|nr:hypothetical protein [Geotalea sp. SG265]
MGKPATILASIALITITAGFGFAETFHNGHTGACEGCHGSSGADGSYASLLGADASSTCLRCHAAANPQDYQIATDPPPADGLPPKAMTPAGDFAYLKKNYTWTNGNGSRGQSPGERHGHNILAAGYGYVADSTLNVSPGGTYPAGQLSCISCHDPHGNYRLVDVYGTITTDHNPIGESGSYGAVPTADAAVGSYRLLAGKGYQPKGSTHVFANDPPIAVAPKEYNRSESTSDTRVAYGKGMSKWCANCHEALLGGSANHLHPADAELGPIAGMYNNYIKSGDMSGMQAGAYTSLVPFQTAEATDPQQLSMEVTSTAGPNPNDRVTCLTCHRAHASGWDSITRWNARGTFITVAGEYPGTDAGGNGRDGENSTGKLMAEYKAAMYNRDAAKFAVFQRQLCNKCHGKD